MLTVCFAKRLYLLKTENSKLRKSKYRSPSELHNDNFSLSTIAEGSHPNVRFSLSRPCHARHPQAPLVTRGPRVSLQDDGGPKVPELLPPGARKDEEEEAFVPGAPSPKCPPAKAEPDGTGTNCVTNNLP
ncbi:CSPG5 protein, partial [Crypturellus undulatus]|nr:CSPG5 protein [Crypturellus undulatus]